MNNQVTIKWSNFNSCNVGESFIYLGGLGRGSCPNIDLKPLLNS